MSIRNLDCLFEPRSVAVFGASPRPASVGDTVWRNLREGGYAGALYAVNPKHREIGGQPTYKNLAALPAVPELAVICTPPATVPGLVARLAKAGTRAAVVMTAGLDVARQQAMLDAARPRLLRILGPDGIGLLAPHIGLNASVAHIGATAGPLAFVSQSGALVTAMLDWAQGRGIGFSQVVSLGAHADVDIGDMLDYLATDARTRAILLYIESVQTPRKFMSAARAAARNKPVLVVKAGRSAEGQCAATSHNGAPATSDLVFDAAIRRAGMLRVDTLQDLFLAAETLAQFRGMPPAHEAPLRERLTIVGNSAGAGALAADAAAEAGVMLAPLPEAVRQALDAMLPPDGPHDNPVDLPGDAPVGRYVQAIGALLDARDCGTLLFMHAPTANVPSAAIAQALLPLARAAPHRMLSSWLGDAAVADARRQFRQAGIPTFETPEQAVRAFSWLVTYRRNQEQLMEAPPAPSTGGPALHGGIDLPRVRTIVDDALAAGRQALLEPEAIDLLAACGVPVATGVVAPSADAAAAAASAIGFPVVLKIRSPQLGRKSDVGGVALDLFDAEAVRAAATVMQARVAHLRPDATVEGFTVQPMVRRPQALELTVGARIDPLFGPVLLFGHGGTAAEVVADHAVALPPLSLTLARALVARTRVARLLDGWRDVPAADADALHAVLVAVSQLLADEPRIVELNINPLLVDAQGVIALAARARVDAASPGGAAHFAIRPYPRELVETREWHGRTLTLRPIRPEDEVQHRAFLERLDPRDIRMRVFYSRRTMERSELARLTQIDYEREMAFVATVPGPEGIEETLGVVRATTDPDNVEAEFGIVVRSDLKGGGLGDLLMKKLIKHLRQRGTLRLVATVLCENERMMELARELGFELDAARAEPGTYAIFLPLQT